MENNFYKNLKNAEQIINDAKRYQFRYNQLLNNGNISKLVKDTLPLTTIYGLSVFNLLGKNVRLNRENSTAIYLALAVPNSKIVIANLSKRACFNAYQNMNNENIDEHTKLDFDEQSLMPMCTCAYVELSGKDIIENGIIFKTLDGEALKTQEDLNYILDPQTLLVMEKNMFNYLNHPIVIDCFDELNNSEVWQVLDEQKIIPIEEYSENDLNKLLKTADLSLRTELNNFLCSYISLDMEQLSNMELANKSILHLKQIVPLDEGIEF